MIPLSALRASRTPVAQGVLLIGPYDPAGGEYTFLAPPLGVWRLAGALRARGIYTHVFDPNCCVGSPEASLESILRQRRWDVVGVSTTGMTLRYDLALAYLVKRIQPEARLVAGGMEATFNPEILLQLAPFDLTVLGEGEETLLEIVSRVSERCGLENIAGTAWRGPDGVVRRAHRSALSRDALRDSILTIPYDEMPYSQYWQRLERSYQVGALPIKAEREARLAEIRSVRLITLNYCPMGCTFCSSTNFLNVAQGSTARISRLDADECLTMIKRIVAAQRGVRTIIFQDDIFVFRNDDRILPLCAAIVAAKNAGEIPAGLQFISTNRIDAMTPIRLAAMRQAGFRVLGFGIESFAIGMLGEFNKAQILPFITPTLEEARRLGITPFLDMILTSPGCQLADLAENIRQAFKWILAGCEVGMYPYVIPFSGSAIAAGAAQLPTTVMARRAIEGTDLAWDQPAKILPVDRVVRDTILRMESRFERSLSALQKTVAHVPSRLRSLLWILSAIHEIDGRRFQLPSRREVEDALLARIPEGNRSRTLRSRPSPTTTRKGEPRACRTSSITLPIGS